ncbi:hypothetical protein [Rickettsia amblyommatis]|uniref:Uncharacterized protein n=1 Tax=Rickettsia amblyommatis str. Ac/Pa TaxID=1359164 RepID=A0A0F3N2P4_RICAM|nr:hypothetical protein [Rickettsia amblyommatis]KJV61982.1 hypothetical protein APHACPA_1000 [Rickettsia amblyommatis str. Ac/Pa]
MDNNFPYFYSSTKKIESIAAFFNNDTQSLEYKAFKTLLSLHPSFKITGSDIILKAVATSKETEETLNITFDMKSTKTTLIGLKLQSK